MDFDGALETRFCRRGHVMQYRKNRPTCRLCHNLKAHCRETDSLRELKRKCINVEGVYKECSPGSVARNYLSLSAGTKGVLRRASISPARETSSFFTATTMSETPSDGGSGS